MQISYEKHRTISISGIIQKCQSNGTKCSINGYSDMPVRICLNKFIWSFCFYKGCYFFLLTIIKVKGFLLLIHKHAYIMLLIWSSLFWVHLTRLGWVYVTSGCRDKHGYIDPRFRPPWPKWHLVALFSSTQSSGRKMKCLQSSMKKDVKNVCMCVWEITWEVEIHHLDYKSNASSLSQGPLAPRWFEGFWVVS